MAEYNDCVSRAQRLSVARESFLAGDSLCVPSVRVEDLFIYLRWLVTHLTSVRQFHHYLKVTDLLLLWKRSHFVQPAHFCAYPISVCDAKKLSHRKYVNQTLVDGAKNATVVADGAQN